MRFCFYSDLKDAKGGYTTLLITLIKELHHQKQEVILINFTEGLISNELKKDKINIDIIDLDLQNWDMVQQKIFPTDILIITQFMEIYRHFLKINPRIIYFDINDFICQVSDYKFGIKLPFLGKKLIKKMLKHKSLIFMDNTGIFNLQQNYSLQVANPVILPIPVKVSEENIYLKKQKKTSETLNITYIGRSVDWKMMPLKKILNDCARVDIQNNIHVSIVVDSKEEFEKFIRLEDYLGVAHLSINIEENMPPSLINNFLLQKSDLHFAMGTAALDAAKLGIPTVLVDYSIRNLPSDYGYKWLYETTGNNLGRNLDKVTADPGMSIKEVLSILCGGKEKIEGISKQSHEYVLNNHSVDKIVSKFLVICDQADFRINDSRYYIPYYYKAHNFFKKVISCFSKNKS